MASTEPTVNGSLETPKPEPQTEPSDAPVTTTTAPTATETTEHDPAVENPQPTELAPEEIAATATEATTDSEEDKWPGWPGDCVFRLIVPVLKVGSIIGRKGDLIKKLCEETRARVRVLDGPVGSPDRIVSSPPTLSIISRF